MITLRNMAVAGCLLLIGITAAVAEDTVVLPPNTFMPTQSTDEYLAKDLLIGAKVQNADGKIIGDIEDLILNVDNQVVGVVIGTGGFLGIAEKRIGIALDALTFAEKDGKTTVTLPGVTREHIKAATAFQRQRPKKSLLERAMEKARELTDKGSETASEAYEKTKKQAGPALKKAQEAAGHAYEKAKDAAGRAYEKAKDAATSGSKPATEPETTPDPAQPPAQ